MRNNGRWQPHQVRRLGRRLEDLNPYPVSFVIRGNHIDPRGNAIPYERMTQRSKNLDPRALRYKEWKAFGVHCFQEQARQGFPCEPDAYYRLDVKAFVIGENHADAENIRKGIQDALFAYGDKHVFGMIYPIQHVQHQPRVEVMIDKVPLLEKIENDG